MLTVNNMNLYYFNINDNEFILKQIGENQKYLFDDFNKELDKFVKSLFRETPTTINTRIIYSITVSTS